jgi:RND family efflux transporter MFP subunit
MIYRLHLIAVLAFGTIAIASCKKAAPPPTAAVAVQLGPESYAVATMNTIESGPTISGTLVPRDQAVVRAQISGSVMRVMVDQGRNVRSGEVLATIDNTALTDAVASAKNALVNAQNSYEVARREQQRQETLLKAGAISEQSVDQVRRNAIGAEAAVAGMKAQLANAEKQLSNATIRAPFSGVVSEKNVSAGDVVQPGNALFTIVDPSTLELQGTVPANSLNIVHVGLPIKFDVTGYPNQKFEGKIARINPTADPMTRQVRIYAEIPNTWKALVAGLYAEGRIASILKTALTLPADAVDHRTITPAAFKLDHGVVQRVTVALGTLDEKSGLVEITAGVNDGDTVLRGSAREIAMGTHVKPIAAPVKTDSMQPVADTTHH